ncbi:hypothetical protein BDZ91DRAFT_804607 [Kalaharituber pfeilii]|nr:hypothetical protein BDZ91DRAFT_804607 [Kalaharituber pfeilii]
MQHSLSVIDYANKLKLLASKITHIKGNQDAMIQKFMDGLNRQLWKEIGPLVEGVTDFDQVVKIAQKHEKYAMGASSANKKAMDEFFSQPMKMGMKMSKAATKASWKEVPKKDKPKDKKPANKPTSQQNRGSPAPRGGKSTRGGRGGSRGGSTFKPSKATKDKWFKEGKCLECGSKDHQMKDCPKKSKDTDKKNDKEEKKKTSQAVTASTIVQKTQTI